MKSKRNRFMVLSILAILSMMLVRQAPAKGLKFDIFANYSYDWQSLNADSLWNPGSLFLNTEKDSRLALNLEGKWNYKSIRALLSPLVTMDHEGHSEWKIREAAVTLSSGRFEFTAGRAIVKWGTGYMFTPIGIVTPEKQVSDPEDMLRSRTGGDLFKIDYYTENINLSAVVFKKNNWKNLALFAYGNVKGFDFYGILYYPEYKKLEFGLAVAATIGAGVEVHAEGMMHRRSPVLRHPVFAAENPQVTYVDPQLVQPEDGYYKEFLMGANITVKDINIIVEYYHNDWGLKKVWLERLQGYFAYNMTRSENPLSMWNAASSLEILQQGRRGLSRDYLFLRAWKSFKNVDLSTIFFMNLADRSLLSLFELQYTLSDGISFYVQPLYFTGKTGSEFGENFYSGSMQLGIRVAL